MKKAIVKFGAKVQIEEIINDTDALVLEEYVATIPVEEIMQIISTTLAESLGITSKDMVLDDFEITFETVED